MVTFLFLPLSEFKVRSHVLHFIKTLENCRNAPRLAEKRSVIWISSQICERNWRCSVVFFRALKKPVQNEGFAKQKKRMKAEEYVV